MRDHFNIPNVFQRSNSALLGRIGLIFSIVCVAGCSSSDSIEPTETSSAETASSVPETTTQSADSPVQNESKATVRSVNTPEPLNLEVEVSISDETEARVFRSFTQPVIYVVLAFDGKDLKEFDSWGHLKLDQIEDDGGAELKYALPWRVNPMSSRDLRIEQRPLIRSPDGRVELVFLIDAPTFEAKSIKSISGSFELLSPSKTRTVAFRRDDIPLGPLAHRRELACLEMGEEGNVTTFSFSPNGEWVAGGSNLIGHGGIRDGVPFENWWGGDVFVWNVATGERKQTLKRHKKSVTWVRFTDDGSMLVTCSPEEGRICYWDSKTWELQHELILNNPVVYASDLPAVIGLGHGRNLIAVVDQSMGEGPEVEGAELVGGILSIWDVGTEELVLEHHDSFGPIVEFSPDDKLIAVAQVRPIGVENDQLKLTYRLEIRQVEDGKLIAERELMSGRCSAIHWLSAEEIGIVNEFNYEIYDASDLQLRTQMKWHSDRQTRMLAFYSHDGQRILRMADSFIEIHDAKTGESQSLIDFKLIGFPGMNGDFSLLALSPVGGPPFITPIDPERYFSHRAKLP